MRWLSLAWVVLAEEVIVWVIFGSSAFDVSRGFRPVLLVPLVAPAGLLLLVWAPWARNPRRSLFRDAVVRPVRSEVRLGETLEVDVAIDPARTVAIQDATIALVCSEKGLWRTTGGRLKPIERTFAKDVEPLGLPGSLGAPFSRKVRLPVPFDHPPSWVDEAYGVVTRVELTVSVKGYQDLVVATEVKVLPEVAG